MSNKIKDIVVSVSFLLCIILAFIINIVVKDKDISQSERRKLQQFPKLDASSYFKGELPDSFENYAMDHFILRDEFRSIKTYMKLNVFHQLDNNNLFNIDNRIYKITYPLSEKYVKNTASKINNIYDKYLDGKSLNIYYTIVPDKSYFLEDSDVHLKLDYMGLENIMRDNIISNIKYIDIKNSLKDEYYYDTDTHWRQEYIIDVVHIIADNMGFSDKLSYDYEIKEYGKFYGAYYGQLAKMLKPDTLRYLTNDTIEKAHTYNYETGKESKVYDIALADKSLDKYDIFLSGATPMIEIINNNASDNKELVIFRDSFGSSIAPLFIEGYSKITLVDIRYIASDMIGKFIDFNNQDILFIYSTLVINESGALK